MRLAAVLLVVFALAVLAEVLPLVPVPTPKPPDYDQPSSWLCRPDRSDACAKPTTATVFENDGGKRVITSTPDPAAKIDCFYVYPTVSHATGDNAPIAATGDEIGAARIQLARFASVCRTFAPALSPGDARRTAEGHRPQRVRRAARARSPIPTCSPPGRTTSRTTTPAAASC